MTDRQNAAPAHDSADPGSVDWDAWRKRGIVSVEFGVLLAHNVRPSGSAIKRLRDADDPRVKQILSDQFTASLRMLVDPLLRPVRGEPVGKRKAERLRQEVSLQGFAKWAVKTIDNVCMSTAFRDLAVSASPASSESEDRIDPWDRTFAILRERFPATRAGDVTRRIQTLAKLLVALAVDRHGLEIDQASEKSNGTYAAFEAATGDAGFPPMESETTADALRLAVELVGRERVLEAQARRIARRGQR